MHLLTEFHIFFSFIAYSEIVRHTEKKMAPLNGLKKILLLSLVLSAGSASALTAPSEALEESNTLTLTKKSAPVFVIDAQEDYKPLTPLESLKNAYALLKGTLA